MSELRQRIEALRKPLVQAAGNGFANIGDRPDLGRVLQTASHAVAKLLGDEPSEFQSWCQGLAVFDQRDAHSQAAQVARGLRLCHTLVGPSRPQTAVAKGTGLAAPPSVLRGIGPSLAGRLAERGIETVEDLVWLVPRRYDDARVAVALADAISQGQAGERVTCVACVDSARFMQRGRRRWVDLRVADPRRRARMTVRWFNAHRSMVSKFPAGARVVLSGRLQDRGAGAEMANPDVIEVVLADGTVVQAGGGLIPRYTESLGIAPATLRKACAAAAASYADDVIDGVPFEIASRMELPRLGEALRQLHVPAADLAVDEVEALNAGNSLWHQRLAFEELFVLGLAVCRRKQVAQADVAPACERDPHAAKVARDALPFSLTAAQSRCFEVLAADLCRDVPMNRLLQGDVGAGKTAVAFLGAAHVAAAGHQVAMMAPTEILVDQHYGTLQDWSASAGLRLAKLTASTPRGVRSSTLSMLAAGTHRYHRGNAFAARRVGRICQPRAGDY